MSNQSETMEPKQQYEYDFISQPKTGTILAVAAGFSFYLLSMILSLVGPAGARVDHADQNRAVFTAVLAVTFLLSGLSTWSKFKRRTIDGSGVPIFSLILCALCVLSFFVLVVNGFSI